MCVQIAEFQDLIPSKRVDIYQRFGVTYCLLLQGGRMSSKATAKR